MSPDKQTGSHSTEKQTAEQPALETKSEESLFVSILSFLKRNTQLLLDFLG